MGIPRSVDRKCTPLETLSLSARCLRPDLSISGQCVTKAADWGQNYLEKKIVGIDTSGGHSAMDYQAHNETYGRFLRYTKIAIVGLVLLLAAMKVFLV